jgi:uncharacterized glyoxalase superfamily protein PhnB
MKNITTNIMVKDVNKAIDYYVEKLAFSFISGIDTHKVMKMGQIGDAKFVWAIIKKGNVEIMLQNQGTLVDEVPEFRDKKLGGTFTLYIKMHDVKSFYHDIKDKVDVIKPMHKTFYNTYEFAIKDLNGYVLYFAQTDNEDE